MNVSLLCSGTNWAGVTCDGDDNIVSLFVFILFILFILFYFILFYFYLGWSHM